MASGPKQIAWRFADAAGDWRVSLTSEFLALETTAYESRDDFMKRLGVVLGALREHVKPAAVTRLGLRYIDRVTGEALNDIGDLVRKEVLGIVGAPASAHARHALTETLFDVPQSNEQLLARWGRIPQGGSIDPNAIEPIDEPSWILDIDMFSNEQRDFDPDRIVVDARRYAERLYAMFRWAVSEAFFRRYGGDP